MINPKAKGSRNERKTIKLLESVGYQCIRSAGSLGKFDVVAANRLGMRFIQIKCNAWPGPVEREGLRAAVKNLPPNALIECWRWNDNAREPIIKLLDEFN